MIDKIEDVEKPVLGKYYSVPCIQLLRHRSKALNFDLYMPILSPLHQDKEYLNFPYNHWHFDFRFVSRKTWRWLSYYNENIPNSHHARVLHQFQYVYDQKQSQVADVHPVYKKIRMQREMTEFPIYKKFSSKLQIGYRDCMLKDDFICPHKGVSLKGLPAREDGNVVCPAHGLMWSLKTKKMVSRV